jgi:16S rRNA (adenine1518-N6/adenine1519-N6)-dimethyltransferase
VDSALVRFELRDAPPVSPVDPEQLFAVIRAAFGARRKTLRNALARAGWPAQTVEVALEAVEVEGKRRGETLTLAEFARLSEALPVRETGVGRDGDKESAEG